MANLSKPSSRSATDSALRQKYLKAIRVGDSDAADAIIESALSKKQASPDALYLEVLLPSQRKIGELWATGKLTVAEEHRASQITLSQMDILRRAMKPLEKNGKHVVIAAPENDPHYIPCRVVSDFLVRDGWTVDCLGAGTPTKDLVKFIAQCKPDLLGLSTTLAEAVPTARAAIKQVKKHHPSLPILIGGSAFAAFPELLDNLGHDVYAPDIATAIMRSRELVGLPNRSKDLDSWLTLIGRRIQELRSRKGMRQQDLAEQAQIDRAYLSTLEHGKQNLTVGAMLKLANALQVDLAELFQGERSGLS
ncbi:MAG: cobalamin-dependent protein [Bdellovibrionales bacterium]|nr:cobalamin-dependent protein [Bdellovibrionales bacterium]